MTTRCLRRAFLVAAFLVLPATYLTLFGAAQAAVLESGRFVESDGWKAQITIDCLLKDKLCGSFRYETLGCEGDLIYAGETPAGFVFRTELKAGRCLPGCTVQISSDFRRYAEVCKSDRHDGSLSRADSPAAQTISTPVSAESVPPPVVITAPTVASTRNETSAPVATPAPALATPATPPAAQATRTADSTISGSFVTDEKSGAVTGQVHVEWNNGSVFDGNMVNGKREGKGLFKWANGQSYEGNWRDDMADGEGKFVWANGQIYQGTWVADKPEGRGSIHFANGDQYDGQISNGLPHGKGAKTYASSQDRYEGDFVQGEAHGEGSYRWKSGDLYVGSWQKGKKTGMGRYTWTSGDYWEGEFADDKQTETGRLFFTPTPTRTATSAEVEKLAQQTSAVTDTNAGKLQTGKAEDKSVDRAKLLAIPMVARELNDCLRKAGRDCATKVADGVLNDTLFVNRWQTMSSEKDGKGKGSVFEVDANSQLEAGNVFSWLRSGDGTQARKIGIKYSCRAQTLEIQLVYNCQQQGCTFDPNIDKYAGKVIPATDIKNWFKGACDR
ncbi:MAG TPA: hypothetical protein VLC92_17965 [Rhodocyclaceae bacterium]|nr:hypothetical protein [Rhodocyclaceae bacterium]